MCVAVPQLFKGFKFHGQVGVKVEQTKDSILQMLNELGDKGEAFRISPSTTVVKVACQTNENSDQWEKKTYSSGSFN